MSSYNVASKEWIIRQYDHEVQGASVIKPLTGFTNDGPCDAAVIKPKYTSEKGLAISCGMNPLYGDIDPYWMALAGIDEAIRNIVCVGGKFDRIALLDNFCWGDCTRPEDARPACPCCTGLFRRRTCLTVRLLSPAKIRSITNFECEDGSRIAIPPTLLISAMSLVDNAAKCVTMDIKKPTNLLFIVGITKNELGGSHYYKINNQIGSNVPKVDLKTAPKIAAKISEAIEKGLVASCHDCSEGGLAAALAEMAFAGGFGIEADLRGLPKSAGLFEK